MEKKDLIKAKKLLSEASAIFEGWFNCCDDGELRDSFYNWVILNRKINKFLKTKASDRDVKLK